MNIRAIRLCVQASAWVLASAFCVTSLTGCGANGNLTAGSLGPDTAVDGISGTVHGGPNPIIGAAVTLYATQSVTPTSTNNYGYGSAATQIGSATTGTGGTFTISPTGGTLSCTSGQQAYIVSAGGSTSATGPSNSAILLMAALGPCSALKSSTTVVINELTTIAAAYALSGFTSVTGTSVAISAPPNNNAATAGCTTSSGVTTACAASGLAHAFLNAANLVNSSTGIANSTVPGNAGASVPFYLINTLGNAVEACVNSSGPTSTTCGPLMTNTGNPAIALNSSLSAPTNTLQALLDLALYPSGETGCSTAPATPCANGGGSGSPVGTNDGQAVPSAATTALFNLASANNYYGPPLTAVPPDFTIAINYAAPAGAPWGVATDIDDNVYVTEATTPSTVLSLSSDWTQNWSTSLAGTAGGGCGTTSSACQPALDTLGNVWVADANGLHELTTAGKLGGTYTGDSLNSLTVDLGNNVWTAAYSLGAQTGASTVEEYVQGQTATTLTDVDVNSSPVANAPLRDPTFDSWGNMWAASDSVSSGLGAILLISANNSLSSPNFNNTSASADPAPYPGGSGSHSADPMMDSLGDMWIGSEDELSEVACSTPCTETNGATNYATSMAVQYGPTWEGGVERFAAMDGDNKIVVNAASGGDGYVSVFYPNATYDGNGGTGNTAGADDYLNPCYVTSGSTICSVNAHGHSNIVNASRGTAIDSTGAIWVTLSSGVNFIQVIGPGAPNWPQASWIPNALLTNTSRRPY